MSYREQLDEIEQRSKQQAEDDELARVQAKFDENEMQAWRDDHRTQRVARELATKATVVLANLASASVGSSDPNIRQLGAEYQELRKMVELLTKGEPSE